MIANKSVGAALAAAVAFVAAPGCGAQSTEFRAMSASDHEAAARATTDSSVGGGARRCREPAQR